MTIDELGVQLDSARWFTQLGQYRAEEGRQAISSLEAWRNEDDGADSYHHRIAGAMEWLPGQSSDPDPVHGERLQALAAQAGREEEMSQLSLTVYKRALASLNSMGETPLLRAGAHDFQHVARGGAAYAARKAACEIFLEQPGFWCSLIPLFCHGHWPCGLMPDKTLVVY